MEGILYCCSTLMAVLCREAGAAVMLHCLGIGPQRMKQLASRVRDPFQQCPFTDLSCG